MAKKQRRPKNRTNQYSNPAKHATFLEHIYEFRRRLIWIALSVISFALIGFAIQDSLIAFLLHPAKQQQFIYTTPGGGINFLLQVCAYFGVALSVPMIVYQMLRFFEPLLKRTDRRFIIKCTFFSAVLAATGIAFAYFIGLPAAIHFLSNQFNGNKQIEALLSINDYLSFVTVYLAGAAIMFQLPLLLLFINRITPLKPSKLLKAERWVILVAFIVAAIITPTPDAINQSIIAGPIILTYQIGVLLVWFQNWHSKRDVIHHLSQKDKEEQAKRDLARQTATPMFIVTEKQSSEQLAEPNFASAPDS